MTRIEEIRENGLEGCASLETVLEWMEKAADTCRAQGRNDSALLWSDARAHLNNLLSEVERLENEVKLSLFAVEVSKKVETKLQREKEMLLRVAEVAQKIAVRECQEEYDWPTEEQNELVKVLIPCRDAGLLKE